MHEDSYPNTVDSGPRMSPDGLLVGDVNLHEHSELCCAGSDAANITADTPPPATDARRTRHQEPRCQMRTIGRVLRTPAHNRLRCGAHTGKGRRPRRLRFRIPQIIDRYEAFIQRRVERQDTGER